MNCGRFFIFKNLAYRLDVRHIPIAIYRILLNGPYMLITLGMAIDGNFFIIYK